MVAAGALKPTSIYSVTRIESSLEVVAHLSEGIPRHWLIDNVAFETFLDNELRYGLTRPSRPRCSRMSTERAASRRRRTRRRC